LKLVRKVLVISDSMKKSMSRNHEAFFYMFEIHIKMVRLLIKLDFIQEAMSVAYLLKQEIKFDLINKTKRRQLEKY
jgi:hypothetical protein